MSWLVHSPFAPENKHKTQIFLTKFVVTYSMNCSVCKLMGRCAEYHSVELSIHHVWNPPGLVSSGCIHYWVYRILTGCTGLY